MSSQETESAGAAGQARVRILDAAARQVARSGVRGLRVQQVAKDAGVSVPLLYYHFENRSRLIRSTLERGTSAVPVSVGSDPGTRAGPGLRAVVAGLVASLADDPDVRRAGVLRSEALAAAVFDETLRDGVQHSTEHWCRQIAALIRRAREDGSATPDVDDERAAGQLTALVDGVRERLLAQVIDLATAGARVRRAVELLLAPR